MRRSEFLRAVSGEFGDRGVSILQDLHLGSVGSTGADALANGVDPRAIWLALCEALDVPESRRYGVGRLDPHEA